MLADDDDLDGGPLDGHHLQLSTPVRQEAWAAGADGFVSKADLIETLIQSARTYVYTTAQPPAVVLMAGLQGSGKTTSVAKLSRLLKEREKKKVMVVSADVYRPAAIEQLKTLAGQVGAVFQPSDVSQKPAGNCPE